MSRPPASGANSRRYSAAGLSLRAAPATRRQRSTPSTAPVSDCAVSGQTFSSPHFPSACRARYTSTRVSFARYFGATRLPRLQQKEGSACADRLLQHAAPGGGEQRGDRRAAQGRPAWRWRSGRPRCFLIRGRLFSADGPRAGRVRQHNHWRRPGAGSVRTPGVPDQDGKHNRGRNGGYCPKDSAARGPSERRAGLVASAIFSSRRRRCSA